MAPLPRLPARQCMAREPQGWAGRHRSGEWVWSWLSAGGLAMAAAWRGQRGSHCPRLGALATEVIPNPGMFAATPEAANRTEAPSDGGLNFMAGLRQPLFHECRDSAVLLGGEAGAGASEDRNLALG